MTNTIPLPIDLNPGALSTDAFVAATCRHPDGSLPGTPTPLFPDSTTRTVGVPLDSGPGVYVIAARAKGFTGSNGQFFSPWATPASIRAFAAVRPQVVPVDRKPRAELPVPRDDHGPSATGKVNVAIGRGKKGKYKSFGTAKIRKHAFSKRSGSAPASGGSASSTRATALWPAGSRSDIQITRHVFFRGATFRSSAVGSGAGRGRAGPAGGAPGAAARPGARSWRTVIVIRMLSSTSSVQMNL